MRPYKETLRTLSGFASVPMPTHFSKTTAVSSHTCADRHCGYNATLKMACREYKCVQILYKIFCCLLFDNCVQYVSVLWSSAENTVEGNNFLSDLDLN